MSSISTGFTGCLCASLWRARFRDSSPFVAIFRWSWTRALAGKESTRPSPCSEHSRTGRVAGARSVSRRKAGCARILAAAGSHVPGAGPHAARRGITGLSRARDRGGWQSRCAAQDVIWCMVSRRYTGTNSGGLWMSELPWAPEVAEQNQTDHQAEHPVGEPGTLGAEPGRFFFSRRPHSAGRKPGQAGTACPRPPPRSALRRPKPGCNEQIAGDRATAKRSHFAARGTGPYPPARGETAFANSMRSSCEEVMEKSPANYTRSRSTTRRIICPAKTPSTSANWLRRLTPRCAPSRRRAAPWTRCGWRSWRR